MSTILSVYAGVNGLTNIKTVIYSYDYLSVWNSTALVPVTGAGVTPTFVAMTGITINSVGNGWYNTALPAALEQQNLSAVYHYAGATPAITDTVIGVQSDPCNTLTTSNFNAAIDKVTLSDVDGVSWSRISRMIAAFCGGGIMGTPQDNGDGTATAILKGPSGGTALTLKYDTRTGAIIESTIANP